MGDMVVVGVQASRNGVTPHVGAQGAIPRCICGAILPDKPRWRGARYCSRRCKDRAYNQAHPVTRQARLDFDRVTPAPATGEPYESARVWLLGRLQVGPVSTLELRCPPWRASQNAAQRVLELRNRQHDIRTVRVGRRTWYWLHVDGLPVGCVPEGE